MALKAFDFSFRVKNVLLYASNVAGVGEGVYSLSPEH